MELRELGWSNVGLFKMAGNYETVITCSNIKKIAYAYVVKMWAKARNYHRPSTKNP